MDHQLSLTHCFFLSGFYWLVIFKVVYQWVAHLIIYRGIHVSMWSKGHLLSFKVSPLPYLLLCWAVTLVVFDSVTLWTVARQAPLSVGFSWQDTGVGCCALLQGVFFTQGLNPCLLCALHWQVGALPLASCLVNRHNSWLYMSIICISYIAISSAWLIAIWYGDWSGQNETIPESLGMRHREESMILQAGERKRSYIESEKSKYYKFKGSHWYQSQVMVTSKVS